MTTKILHQRTIHTHADRKTRKGRLVVTCQQTHSSGNAHPHFSLTTGSGSNHAAIRKARPELERFISLHLCDETGLGMHAVANAVYFIGQGKYREAYDLLGYETADISYEAFTDALAKELLNAGEAARQAADTRASLNRELSQVVARLKQWREAWPGRAQGDIVDEFIATLRDTIAPLFTRRGGSLHTAMELQQLEKLFSAPGRPRVTLEKWRRELRLAVNNSPLSPSNRDMFADIKVWLQELYALQAMADTSSALKAGKDHAFRAHLTAWVETEVEYLAPARKELADEFIAWMDEKPYESDLDDRPDLTDGDLNEDGAFVHDYDALLIRIDGEVSEVESVLEGGYLPLIDLGGEEYYLAESSEAAGEAAREYWVDMSKNDRKEFACLVGEDNLVAWALGDSAGPGSTQVSSLEEWFDLHLSVPEEMWASADGEECDVQISLGLADELGLDTTTGDALDTGWVPAVAYRHN